MQVNLFSRPLQSLNVQQQNDEAHNISLEKNLKTLDKAQAELSKIDKQIASLNKQSASVETLAMLAAQQKQVVLAMLGGNPEMAIAALLAQGIEQYGDELELIQMWTQGGSEAVQAALSVMLEGLTTSAESVVDFEDVLQVALLDFISNIDNWSGANQIVDDVVLYRKIRRFLGNFGSGSHVPHHEGENLLTASDIRAIFDVVKNLAPEGSVASNALNFLDQQQDLNNIFSNMSENYYDNDQGWYEGSFGAGLTVTGGGDDVLVPGMNSGMSPVMRLTLLQMSFLNGDLAFSAVDDVLTSDMEELCELFGSDPFSYISSSDSWQIWTATVDSATEWTGPDFGGVGVDVDFINDLVNAFPARELTKEELKEVNRIGDQIQMLQETLKYWLSIMRDEQLAAARNI
ncbi:TPA: hypothetical protein PMB70_003077 [Vibrio cholerae]|nr:hypothetical protein [Vibrio cholerae]